MYVKGMMLFEFESTYGSLINLAWHVDVYVRCHVLTIWNFRQLSHYFQNSKRWSAITRQHDAAPTCACTFNIWLNSFVWIYNIISHPSCLRRFNQLRCGRRLCPIVFVTEFWIIRPLGSPSTTTLQHHLINHKHQSFYWLRLDALKYSRRLCAKFCGRTLVRWVVVWCFLWVVIWMTTAEALQKIL